jgi:hypothetical protein
MPSWKRRCVENAAADSSLVKIDCIVRKSHPCRRLEFSRRRWMDFGGFLVWIVSPEDLLLSWFSG